ncbi:bacteriophage N4 adsorption protein A [Bordetella sp. N]|uniref:NfrA family protein n=1 Tax=Bordetella sp. N TaxID=1746199 RepID=UPI00070CD1C1|nr:bacteriophage N4 adsorption protein A [Bordetella sp. N]ALM86290.1 hypothetical protein ASB57_28085 [Bordetella sp. N]
MKYWLDGPAAVAMAFTAAVVIAPAPAGASGTAGASRASSASGASAGGDRLLPLELSGPPLRIAAEAYRAYDSKSYDLAISRAREVLRQRPDSQEMRKLITLAQRDKYRRDHPMEFIARKPPGFQAAERALAAYNDGDYDLALAESRVAVRQAPRNLDYRLMLIESLQRLNNRDAAEAEIDAAIRDLGQVLQLVTLRDGMREQRQNEALQVPYALMQAGDRRGADAAFADLDRKQGLPPSLVQDAAYNAMQVGNDRDAVKYFKRAIDAKEAGNLPMSEQDTFQTRRVVADVERRFGLTNTTTYRGANAASGISGAPSSPNDSVQNTTEVYWRPLGYGDARYLELFAGVTDTLWSRGGVYDTGADALQGDVGARVKPFTQVNLVAALERVFPLGGANVQADWLARLGYGSSIGTDLRVDVPAWWTSQLYAETGHYFRQSRTYVNSEWQLGRSYRLDSVSPKLVVFPHAVAAYDYDTQMNFESGNRGSPGSAAGLGAGVSLRYWFREDRYHAPQSYWDLSLQYRARVFGDDRARGVFARFTYSY